MVRTAGPAMFWRNGNASGMAYEEASVAGETPDRSKQRKSSGNPTGAEPSVPAPDERDPRLAVAREIPAAREVPEAPEVREDQATAVFSTKAVTEAGSTDSKGSKGSKGSGGSAEGAGSAEAEPKAEESGDARLRAAVAAWVASADEEDPGSAETSAEAEAAAGGGSSEASEGSGDSEAADGVRSGESGAADGRPEAQASTADSGTAGDAGADSAAGSADRADGAGASGGAENSGDAETAPGANVGSAAGASGAADAPAGAGDAEGSGGGEADDSADSSRSADSADDASASGEVDEAAGVGGSSGDAGGSGDAEAGDAGADSAAGSADGADGARASGDAEAAADANAGSASDAGASGEADEPAPAGDAEGSGDGDAVDSADAGAEAPADSALNGASADDASASGDVDDAAGVGGSSGGGASDSADADAADSAEAESSAESAGPDDDAPEAADKPAGGEGASESSGDAESSGDPEPADGESSSDVPEPRSGGVDQATAVFKALPPKAVDQPTTMLKLGDHKPAAKKPESPADKAPAKPEAKPAAKPERESERTSKFVALKPLDNPPSSGALPPAAEAPAAPAAKAPTPEKSNVGPERTTQQPLPPRPPLDLLAELTNTPPPPETPVRTAVRRVKIWTPLVLLLVVVFAVVQAVRPLPTPTLTLTAKETVSFEGDKPSMPWPSQGQAAMDVNGIGTFGTSGDQKPVPIASIAKVMTVYLILRDHPLKKGGSPGPDIPVDAAAEKHYETGKSENESVVKVTEGQEISEYEALQAVMLPSANNVAKLLARWDTKSNSEDEFVAKMNKTAKELGMKNTHYTDPSGLDKTTVSTAEDLVKLGRAAMEDPVFNEISRQPSYKDLNGDKQNNFFGLVPTVAIGIKTGTTTAAGGNILFAAEKKVGGETRTIIGAALGQYGKDGVANIDEVTGVTRKLIEAGQGALTSKKIVEKGDVVGQVDDGLGGTTPVVATKDVSAAGWSGLTVKLKLGEDGGETIPHSAKAGTKVGVLSVGDGKDGAVEVPVALQKDLTEPGFGAKLQRVG